MHDRTILELNSDHLILAFHQEPDELHICDCRSKCKLLERDTASRICEVQARVTFKASLGLVWRSPLRCR